MIQLVLRLLWAVIWTTITAVVDTITFVFAFRRTFGFTVDTRNRSFLKPIDTLGEHGLWKSYFHWAVWRTQLKFGKL